MGKNDPHKPTQARHHGDETREVPRDQKDLQADAEEQQDRTELFHHAVILLPSADGVWSLGNIWKVVEEKVSLRRTKQTERRRCGFYLPEPSVLSSVLLWRPRTDA